MDLKKFVSPQDPAVVRERQRNLCQPISFHREGLFKGMNRGVLTACRKDIGLIGMGPMFKLNWGPHLAQAALGAAL